MWIESMLPPPSVADAPPPKEFNAGDYQDYCKNSNSDLAHQAHSVELEILKQAMASQEAQTRTMQLMMEKMIEANRQQNQSMAEMQEKVSQRMDEMVKSALQYRRGANDEQKQELNWLGRVANKVGNWFGRLFG